MKKIPVTPEIRAQVDPFGKITPRLMSFNSYSYNAPSLAFRDPERALADWFKRQENVKFKEGSSDYVLYNEQMREKIGMQGGTLPLSRIKELAASYYDLKHLESVPSEVIRGRDYLISRIRSVKKAKGGPAILAYVPITGTAAGIPTGGTKGTFHAETYGVRPNGHLYPAYPGVRRMRGKDRIIFVDAVGNVQKLSPYLSGCRNWLKDNFPEYFSAWRNPKEILEPLITLGLEKRLASVEEDYKQMDTSVTLDIVRALVLPVYEELLPGNIMFDSWIEELFNQPLYLGDEVWLGEHALFSGQTPTNDFETIITIILQISVQLTLRIPMFHMALGDDATMMVHRKHIDQVHRLFVDYATSVGMHVHDDGVKNRISTVDTRFCRRCYSITGRRHPLGSIIGYYPTNLCVNNVLYPEKLPSSTAQGVSADLQRCDNVYGQPDFPALCSWLLKWYEFDLQSPADEIPRDWWERLYGEKWAPESSPTYCMIKGIPYNPSYNVIPMEVDFKSFSTYF